MNFTYDLALMSQEAPRGDIFLGKETDSIEKIVEGLRETYDLNLKGLEISGVANMLRNEFSRIIIDVDQDAKIVHSFPPAIEEVDGEKRIVHESARAYIRLEWEEDGEFNRHEVSVVGGGEIIMVKSNENSQELDLTSIIQVGDEEAAAERS